MENYTIVYIMLLNVLVFITIGMYVSKVARANNLANVILLSDQYIDKIKRIVMTSIEIIGATSAVYKTDKEFHDAIAMLALKEVKTFLKDNLILTNAQIKDLKDETLLDVIYFILKGMDNLISEYRKK